MERKGECHEMLKMQRRMLQLPIHKLFPAKYFKSLLLLNTLNHFEDIVIYMSNRKFMIIILFFQFWLLSANQDFFFLYH